MRWCGSWCGYKGEYLTMRDGVQSTSWCVVLVAAWITKPCGSCCECSPQLPRHVSARRTPHGKVKVHKHNVSKCDVLTVSSHLSPVSRHSGTER
jgi:hypothetical protein